MQFHLVLSPTPKPTNPAYSDSTFCWVGVCMGGIGMGSVYRWNWGERWGGGIEEVCVLMSVRDSWCYTTCCYDVLCCVLYINLADYQFITLFIPSPHSLQLHPRSVRIGELMCWCWCDLPQERPNFTQILGILQDICFTNLIATAEVLEPTKKREQITTACLDTVIAERIKVQKEMFPSMSQMMSLMQSKGSWQGEHAMQMFYGTDYGQCGMMQFQETGTVKKVR